MATTTIQSLERGLKSLSILGKSHRPLPLSEIAVHFKLDRSSVFRLISTLMKSDFVRQDPVTKRYSLGFRVLELAGAFSEYSNIESVIRPIMRRVCDATRQNTHLAVMDRSEIVFIAVEQPRESVSLNVSVGTREPAMVTALGRAFIAFLPASEMESAIAASSLKTYTRTTITDKDDLIVALQRVRKERLAYDNEEYKPGIACFAAPVFNHRREVLYTIGISGSAEMIRPRLKEYGNIVRLAGIEASSLLGCTEPPRES